MEWLDLLDHDLLALATEHRKAGRTPDAATVAETTLARLGEQHPITQAAVLAFFTERARAILGG